MNAKLLLTLLLIAAAPLVGAADFFAPPFYSAPAVVIISGASGTHLYRWYAQDVAKLGYAVALVSGKDICVSSTSSCSKTDDESAENLKRTMAELQSNKRVALGKVAVISFSLGGGGALVHAAPLSETIAGVVAYYPSITKIQNIDKVAAQVAVPTLILSGEQDKYFNCCLVESMQEFESGARAKSIPVELVVYPNVGHGFNLDGSKYRPDETADAWERTKMFLARVLPLRR